MSDDSPEPDRSAEEDAEIIRRERERHMELLRDIPARRADRQEHERTLVHYARLIGIPWDDIAQATGTTADAALAQYGEPPPGTDPF